MIVKNEKMHKKGNNNYMPATKMWGSRPMKLEKVSPIFEIQAHYRDLVFQSNEGMTSVLIKPS